MAGIADKIKQIRQAIFGKDVRESIASGIEAINIETENTTKRQGILETIFNQLIINAGNSNAEIVDARVDKNGKAYDKLKDRIDYNESQLEEKTTRYNSLKDLKNDASVVENSVALILNSNENAGGVEDGFVPMYLIRQKEETDPIEDVEGIIILPKTENLVAELVCRMNKYPSCHVQNSDSAIANVLNCAYSYIPHASEIGYGDEGNLFEKNTYRDSRGKWLMSCSLFVMAGMYGISYENSKYNGNAENICLQNSFKDENLKKLIGNHSGTGGYRTHRLAYLFARKGYCFIPDENLSNVKAGDILFYSVTNGNQNLFNHINHSAIFVNALNDNRFLQYEVADDNGARAIEKEFSYANTNVVMCARLPLGNSENISFLNLIDEGNIEKNSTEGLLSSYSLNRALEKGKHYTCIVKATYPIAQNNTYPALYDSKNNRLGGYQFQFSNRPKANIYIFTFVPTSDIKGLVQLKTVSNNSNVDKTATLYWINILEGVRTSCQNYVPSPLDFLKENYKLGITDKTTFIPSDGTVNTSMGGCYYRKRNSIVELHIALTGLTANNSYSNIITLPEGFRPISTLVGKGGGDSYYNNSSCQISPSGNINIRTDSTSCNINVLYIAD